LSAIPTGTPGIAVDPGRPTSWSTRCLSSVPLYEKRSWITYDRAFGILTSIAATLFRRVISKATGAYGAKSSSLIADFTNHGNDARSVAIDRRDQMIVSVLFDVVLKTR
jgi:hypothetical protein